MLASLKRDYAKTPTRVHVRRSSGSVRKPTPFVKLWAFFSRPAEQCQLPASPAPSLHRICAGFSLISQSSTRGRSIRHAYRSMRRQGASSVRATRRESSRVDPLLGGILEAAGK